MDEGHTASLGSIYTRIGIIMEDTSIIALKLGGSGDKHDPARVRELECAVHEIKALMTSAQLISE